MRRYLPLAAALLIVIAAGLAVVAKKRQGVPPVKQEQNMSHNIGTFSVQKRCARMPQFLKALKVPQPVMIDLSQKQFKGIALLYGQRFQKVLHPKQWEQYGHFGTYALDREGNVYLVPMPFISILPTTFNLQKNIYRLDSKTGKLSSWLSFDEISPSANNPYGMNAIVYDCDDGTLWASAIDRSDYRSQKGRIYHIDPSTKKVIQTVEGFDALSLAVIRNKKGEKYLLAGSARDNGLYAFPIKQGKLDSAPRKLLTLPSVDEHIRKIKIKANNTLELQAIPFTYTLIAQTGQKDRAYYHIEWNSSSKIWKVIKKL